MVIDQLDLGLNYSLYSCKITFLYTKYLFGNLGYMIKYNKDRMLGSF